MGGPTVTANSETLIEWVGGRLLSQEEDLFVVEQGEEVYDECGTLAGALASVAEITDQYAEHVTYVLARETIWEAAAEAGLDSIFIRSVDGWVNLDGYWLPAIMHPGYHDFDGLEPLYSCGDFGWRAEVYGWEGVLVLSWRSPEGVDSGWEVLGEVSLEEAIEQADEKVDDEVDDWGFDFDSFMGLRNLSPSEQFELPSDAVPLRSCCSYSEYGESLIADLTIYTLEQGAAVHYLVTVTGWSVVIGRYGSVESLEQAVKEEAGLIIEWDDL
jgi:hypothetical protein